MFVQLSEIKKILINLFSATSIVTVVLKLLGAKWTSSR